MPTTKKTEDKSFDEIFEKRNKENLDKIIQPKKEEQAENRTRILQVLYVAGHEGISQKDLIKETGLSDTAIQNHLKELIEKGMVVRKEHKQDHYRLTTEAAKSVELQSWLFGDEALRELRNGFSKFIVDMNYNVESNPESVVTKPLFRAIDTSLTLEEISNRCTKEYETINKISVSLSTKTEKELFKFAMDVGVLTTYVMLKAIKTQSNDKTGKEKEYDSLIWTKNSISVNNILFHFIQSDIIRSKHMLKESFAKKRIERLGKKADPVRKKEIQDKLIPDELYSQFEVDEKTYNDLEESFEKIWPFTYLGLEQVMNTLYFNAVETLKTINNEDNLVSSKMIDEIKRNRELKEQNGMRNKNKD